MAHRIQFVALHYADGTVGVMHFLLDPVGMPERLGTDEEIEAEISKSVLPEVLTWERISLEQYQTIRAERNT